MNEKVNVGQTTNGGTFKTLANWDRYALVVVFLLVLTADDASAQNNTVSSLEAVKTWVNSIINLVFIMAILYAAIMAIIKFVRSDQGAWGYAFTVLVALIFWGGFNTYKEDIFALMGGQNELTIEAGGGQ